MVSTVPGKWPCFWQGEESEVPDEESIEGAITLIELVGPALDRIDAVYLNGATQQLRKWAEKYRALNQNRNFWNWSIVRKKKRTPFLGTVDTISEIMIFSTVVRILIFYNFAEDHDFWNGVYCL